MSTEETTESTVFDEINTAFDDMATEKAQAKADQENMEGSREGREVGEVVPATEEASEEINEQDETTKIKDKFEESGSISKENSEVISGESQVGSLISDDLLTRAAQAGIPLVHARKFENEESLLGAVEHYEKAWEQAETEATPAKDPLSELPKLDPEIHDPQVIAQFDRLTNIIKQEREAGQTETQAMQERLQAMEDLQADAISATREAENTESMQWFNKQISGLGENFQEALGEGDSASLNSQSKQFANRAEIARQVSVMEAGYEALGQKVPSRDDLFGTAAKLVLQDEFQQLHEKKLSGKLEKRAGQHISRAGGQKVSSTQTPIEFAAAELQRKFGIEP